MLLGCLAFRPWILLVPSPVRYARCMIILNDVVQTFPFLVFSIHFCRLLIIAFATFSSVHMHILPFILVYNWLLHLLFTLRYLPSGPSGSVLLCSIVPSLPCDISTSTPSSLLARRYLCILTHSHRTLTTSTHLSRHPTRQSRAYLKLIPERPALPRFKFDLLARIGNR